MENNELDQLLKSAMSANESGIAAPETWLVDEARRKVMARKNTAKQLPAFLEQLFSFFTRELRFYHVGLSILLVSGGVFYMNEPNYGTSDPAGSLYSDQLSAKNNTISVTSSTMLTSIPTLVIRN